MSPPRGATFNCKRLAAALLFHVITNSDISTFGVRIEWNRVVWCSGVPSELRICGYPDSCLPDWRQALKASAWIIVPSNRWLLAWLYTCRLTIHDHHFLSLCLVWLLQLIQRVRSTVYMFYPFYRPRRFSAKVQVQPYSVFRPRY
jgi:hypothetical protein